MVRPKVTRILLILLSVFLFACAAQKEVELQLEVKASMDGAPAAQAKVLLDGVEEGVTDADGMFTATLQRMPETRVKVSVIMESPDGYRVEPWEGDVEIRQPQKGVVDTYPLDAVLESTKQITVRVTAKGTPLEGASVKVDGEEAAMTAGDGEINHVYTGDAKRKASVEIRKKGYIAWKRTIDLEPGMIVDVALFKPSILTIVAVTEEYGQEMRLSGVEVVVGKKNLGKTGPEGTVQYVYRGAPGKTFWIKMTAPGHLPSVFKAKVTLDGRRTVKRFFYPVAQKPVRVGIYGYSGNVPDEDLTSVLTRAGEAVGNILFSHMSFKDVPEETLRERIKSAKTDIETMTTKGWRDNSLMGTIDAVILGSVSRNDKGYIIETKVHTSDGKLAVSQIGTARSEKNIKDVAKKVVATIMKQYPFQGTLLSEKDERFQVSLGKSDYQLKRKMEFALMSPSRDRQGRIKGYKDIGTLRIVKTEKRRSWAEVVEIRQGETARVGHLAVRRVFTEEESRASQGSFVLVAKGGVPPDVDPLAAVNVYLDDTWSGTTGSDGRTLLPAKIGRTYDLLLYRHGYQQYSGKVKPEKEGEVREFNLTINNSLLKVESVPSGAKVYLDGTMVGRTPIDDGKQVEFGFHTVKLTAGEDYRDWEEVVEFDKKVIDLSGPSAVRFVKDHLAIGKRAEQRGDMESAMDAYRAAEKGHPDYSDAHFRLAQLYMDEQDDYTSAIREFENVLSLPENQQLIYKQYSVAYTNLGHAYYELGSSLVTDDRQGAAQNFGKAIEYLERAKQYTRFFPTRQFDEALHDTYYYLALSYHKLYLVTKKDTVLDKADFAWREYFDFFPKKLEGVEQFAQMRQSAEKFWTQIQDLM